MINKIIKDYLAIKLELSRGYDFVYDNDENEYIEHDVEGTNITLLFPEKSHVKKARKSLEEDKLIEYYSQFGDILVDIYDYERVVGYRIEGGEVIWL